MKVAGSYETELKITLLLILLFLILISFNSLRVGRTLSGVYREDNYRQLLHGAMELTGYISRDVELMRGTRRYRDMLDNTEIVRAAYLKLGALESAEKDDPGAMYYEDSRIIREYWNNLTDREKEKLLNGEPVRTGFGKGRDIEKIAVIYPFNDGMEQQWIGLFQKNASGLKLVNTVMKYNYLFQVAGIIAVLLVAYAYLKITLNPFRKIADEARKVQDQTEPSDKSVEHVVQTFRDTITRLRENEDKLKELYNNSQERADRLEQYNQYIIESMLSGLIGVDNNGRIVHLNRAARRILSLPENYNESDSFKVTLGHVMPLCDLLQKIMDENAPVERLEQTLQIGDGDEISLGISGSPVYDHKNRLVGAILLIADLTEVRRLQQEIAFKEKMAAVGEMSAGLAHEMRNAMMAIVGYSKILQKTCTDDSNIMDIARSISTESETCETMLKRFLSFANPASFSPEPLSLPELGESVAQKFEQLSEEKNVNLIRNIQTGIPELTADRTALDQVITNLLKNAIEAVPSGGTVELGMSYNQLRNYYIIEICDNGPGIPEEHLGHIFSPFFTTKETGTGLGLAIVKKLVSSMGGRIEVENIEGNGCRFIVRLLSSMPENKSEAHSANSYVTAR